MCLNARQVQVVDQLLAPLQGEGYTIKRTEVKFCNGPRPAWEIGRHSKTIVTITDTETGVRQYLHGAAQVTMKHGEVTGIMSCLGRGRFVGIEGMYFFEVADESSPLNGKLFKVMGSYTVGVPHRPAPDALDPETIRELAQDFGFR
jgi:hypothetical protein